MDVSGMDASNLAANTAAEPATAEFLRRISVPFAAFKTMLPPHQYQPHLLFTPGDPCRPFRRAATYVPPPCEAGDERRLASTLVISRRATAKRTRTMVSSLWRRDMMRRALCHRDRATRVIQRTFLSKLYRPGGAMSHPPRELGLIVESTVEAAPPMVPLPEAAAPSFNDGIEFDRYAGYPYIVWLNHGYFMMLQRLSLLSRECLAEIEQHIYRGR